LGEWDCQAFADAGDVVDAVSDAVTDAPGDAVTDAVGEP
jgi:hypothetical protein